MADRTKKAYLQERPKGWTKMRAAKSCSSPGYLGAFGKGYFLIFAKDNLVKQ